MLDIFANNYMNRDLISMLDYSLRANAFFIKRSKRTPFHSCKISQDSLILVGSFTKSL